MRAALVNERQAADEAEGEESADTPFGGFETPYEPAEQTCQSVEQQIDAPFDIDEHRPEIAVQIAGHVKGLGIQQDMVVAHIYEVGDEPGVDDHRQHDEPSLVAQEESERSKKERGGDLDEDTPERRVPCHLAECVMVKQQRLTEDQHCKQSKYQPVTSLFHSFNYFFEKNIQNPFE